MPRRVEERLRPITPQLAWRVAVLGGIACVLFAIVYTVMSMRRERDE